MAAFRAGLLEECHEMLSIITSLQKLKEQLA
jgi:hypothetical protein